MASSAISLAGPRQSAKSDRSRAQGRIVFSALVGMTLSTNPVLSSSFPLFLQPVSKEFGWGRDVMPAAVMASALMMAICFPFAGRLADRFGSRRVLLVGFALFGLALISMALLDGSQSHLIATYLVLGVVGTLPTGIAYGRVITTNFTNHRGLVLGLCLGVGGGLGAALIPLGLREAIDLVGWRRAYILLGALPIVVALPAVLLLPREVSAPSAPPMRRASNAALFHLASDRTFWMLVAIAFFANMAVSGTIAHLVALLDDRGVARAAAGNLLSLLAVGTITGQTLSGMLLDRVRSPRAGIPLFGSVLLGVTVLVLTTSVMGATIGVSAIGLGVGAEYAFFSYVISRMFPINTFSTVYGSVFSASALASGVGPLVMGATFEATGTYQPALAAFMGAMAFCMAMVFWLKPYSFDVGERPARQSES